MPLLQIILVAGLLVSTFFLLVYMFRKRSPIRNHTALIVINYQKDLCLSTSRFYIPKAETLVSTINHYIDQFRGSGHLVIFSREWHPEKTMHFLREDNSSGLLPDCIEDTTGAEFHPELNLGEQPLILNKFFGQSHTYSAFDWEARISQTNLDQFLKKNRVRHISLCGLTTEHCILKTAEDALILGYQVTILTDACKALNLDPDDGIYALISLKEKGVNILKPRTS